MNDIKVYGVGLFGMVATTGWGVVVDKLGPVLNVLIQLGQIGVAVVTILYIYSKWKKNRE